MIYLFYNTTNICFKTVHRQHVQRCARDQKTLKPNQDDLTQLKTERMIWLASLVSFNSLLHTNITLAPLSRTQDCSCICFFGTSEWVTFSSYPLSAGGCITSQKQTCSSRCDTCLHLSLKQHMTVTLWLLKVIVQCWKREQSHFCSRLLLWKWQK